MSPEQIESQKIDVKLNELQNKKALRDNPMMQSPTDALREMLMPPRPRVKPDARMKVLSNNGELLGEGKVSKHQYGGTAGGKNEALPYNPSIVSNAKLSTHGTNAVAKYQAMMNAMYGLNLTVDGAWGPKTQEAYEKFVLPQQAAEQAHAEGIKQTNHTYSPAMQYTGPGVKPTLVSRPNAEAVKQTNHTYSPAMVRPDPSIWK